MEAPDPGRRLSDESPTFALKSNHQGNTDSLSDLESEPNSPLTPVHWSHRRRESYASLVDNKPAPIILEDHTDGPLADNDAVWEKGI